MKLPKNWLDTNKSTIMLFMVFLLLFLMGCMTKQSLDTVTVEGFQPGEYPKSLTKRILGGWYKPKKYTGLKNISYAQSSKNYPIFPADHCGTNNLKYWDRPMNGTCAPAGICTPLYERTNQQHAGPLRAPANDAKGRVNFYVSKS